MLRAIFPQAVFISKCPQVKVQVSLQSAHLHADLQALLDSGATDNFLNPLVVNQFNLPMIELPKSRVVRNVNGTKNRSGSITHATKLEVQYQNHTVPLLFLIMDMCYDPGPYHQFSTIFRHLFLHSRSLIPYLFPYAPLGLPPDHLMNHLTIPQSDITCHHSAVRSILQYHYLTLYGLPAHYHIMMDHQLMMRLYLELPTHDEPYYT